MATVTNNLTRIHDAEGALTAGNIPAGGAGASANTDIFLQGAQSLGRRQTNTSDTGGFSLVDGADNDCSASGVHIGAWIWVTHYGILDDLRVSLGSGTTPASNYKYYTVPLTEYPALGGWKRVWVDPTGGTVGAGTYTLSQTRHYGVQVSFTAAPGGNAQNLILDAADFVTGAALTLTGTSGLWSDLSTSDQNSTNQYGVFREIGGVYNCAARIQLGSASSLVFTDSNATIVFPQQALVSDTWMGINCDLQNASTDIEISASAILSAGAKKGDFIVTGTSGLLLLDTVSLSGIRIVDLTSAVTVVGCTFLQSGLVSQNGASISGCAFVSATGAVALEADNVSLISDCSFVSDGTGHGMEITGVAANMTLTDLSWSGYAGSDGSTGNEAVFVNIASGSMNLTISGGTVPSIRTAGATVTVIAGAVSATVNVKNTAGANIQDARVHVYAAAGGPFPSDVTVTITNSGTTSTVSHSSHGMATNDKVRIKGASHLANNGVFTITVTNANTYTYTMGSTPGSNPTGTIKATFVVLDGLTDVSGNITMSRVFSSDQPIDGRVRKSSGSPLYRTGTVSGTVDSETGFSTSVQLILDT